MNLKKRFYPEVRFGGFTGVDTTIAFYSRVNALLEPRFDVLDVGCGRGAYKDDPVRYRRELRILKGKARKVVGIDMDPNASANPCIDEFRLQESGSWPVETDSVDLLVSDYVMEHVEDPRSFFSEAARVVRPDGYVCIRTPNRWSYIAILASVIPDRYHARVTNVVQENRKPEDVFPTFYRCNTAGKLRDALQKSGFDAVVYHHEPEPAYLHFSTLAYFLGVLHQRFAPRFMKPSLYAFARRGSDGIGVPTTDG